jgi:hypothetical protein
VGLACPAIQTGIVGGWEVGQALWSIPNYKTRQKADATASTPAYYTAGGDTFKMRLVRPRERAVTEDPRQNKPIDPLPSEGAEVAPKSDSDSSGAWA